MPKKSDPRRANAPAREHSFTHPKFGEIRVSPVPRVEDAPPDFSRFGDLSDDDPEDPESATHTIPPFHGRHEVPTESEVLSMFRLTMSRFYDADRNHHRSYANRTSIDSHTRGACPHLRDRIWMQSPLDDFGASLHLGIGGVYVHAVAPYYRYCSRCSNRALQLLGDNRVCATCHLPRNPQMSSQRQKRQGYPVFTLYSEDVSTIRFVLPLCDRCREIIVRHATPDSIIARELASDVAAA